MSSCTIFTHIEDLSQIPDRLRKLYGPASVEVEGGDEAWTTIRLTRRRLIRKATLTLNALHAGPRLDEMKRGMQHVFRSVPTDMEEIQKNLLLRIGQFQSAIGVVPEGGKMGGFEDALFALTKALGGLIFWEGKQMLNEKGSLVLDFEGNCRVDKLPLPDGAPLPEMEEFVVSPNALERKERTEEWLVEMAVPMNKRLPAIEAEEAVTLCSPEAIAWRALALTLVALKGEGLDPEPLAYIHAEYGLAGHLSPAEKAFFEDQNPEDSTRINFAWRYESLFVMLWALGHAEELGYPGGICDVQAAVSLIRDAGGVQGLLKDAQPRSKAEVLDEADKIYRLHWAVVDARLRGEGPPADLDPGVVYERHYALNWLIGDGNADWDEVKTHT